MICATLLLLLPLCTLALVLALLGIARALDRLAAAVRERKWDKATDAALREP